MTGERKGSMSECGDEMEKTFQTLAEEMIRRYACGLLDEAWLLERLRQEWRAAPCGAKPEIRALEWFAQGLCSQVLCEACRSSETSRRDLGFENLKFYLEEVLARAFKSTWWWTDDLKAETLQQTLVEIFNVLRRGTEGPSQPAAFLKWARVILFRQLSRCFRQVQRADWLSLDAQDEAVLSTLVDEDDVDPLDTVLHIEFQEELKKVISTLKNEQYREVLLKTFLAGLEESELAANWQVRVRDIYLWRCRALQALRKQPGVVQALRQLA